MVSVLLVNEDMCACLILRTSNVQLKSEGSFQMSWFQERACLEHIFVPITTFEWSTYGDLLSV
jgi:hypothetical protein